MFKILLLIYFIPGLCWSLLMTGIFIAKAITRYRRKDIRSDLLDVIALVAIFFITWIGWPWSFYYNMPKLVERVKAREL